MLVWVLNAHFVPSLGTFELFILASSSSLFVAAIVYVVYLAIEPYVRRHWPHGIISWSRLLMGRLRDPLVGRDALFGVLLGVTWTLIFQFMFLALKHIGASPDLSSPEFFLGARHVLGACASHLTTSIEAALVFFFLMFVFRVLFRKPWLAALAFVALWTFTKSYGEHHLTYILPAYVAVYGIAAFVVLRFGFIALAVGIFTVDLVSNLPLTTDLSSWYLGNSIFAVLLIAAITVWGCYCALAGQKLIKENLFE
jgi:ABC-type antimicrobial peptide transport system permease subunit